MRFVERRAAPDSAALVPVDAEGDGIHDFALARGRHLTLAREVEGDLRAAWQHNFDTAIRPPVPLDLDGDGREELVVSMLRGGTGEITVLDGNEQPVERFGPIAAPPGPDRPWEGLLAPAAVARTAQGRALLCLQLTTYSGHARTLMSLPRGARGPAWRATFGPWPAQTLVTDLDGDSLDEVLIGADSPDNGVSSGGTDDSHAWALAFGGDGRTRWARPLAGAFSQVRVLPLPGPAPRTVLASVHSHHARDAGAGQILLLDGATGEVRTRRDFRWQPGWPRLLDSNGPRVVLGASDGTLRVLDGTLEVRAERDL
ncbi:MAG: VCBS repeat-containing protein, partial [Gemmatimonadales bacterium]|nr:VCBS repeat-containing protein [Gemmatimonadales bacterium]